MILTNTFFREIFVNLVSYLVKSNNNLDSVLPLYEQMHSQIILNVSHFSINTLWHWIRHQQHSIDGW